MKRYRVLKPHSWIEKPGGQTIHGKPGEMAVLPDAVFAEAPEGTFSLLPGEEGYVAPAPVLSIEELSERVIKPELEKLAAEVHAEFVALPPDPKPKKRTPKAQAFKDFALASRKPKKR